MRHLHSSPGHAHTSAAPLLNAPLEARDVLIGREPDILGDITAPGVAAAIWQRALDPVFEEWVGGLTIEELPELRVTVPVELAEEAVRTACAIARIPDGPAPKMLASDVGALAFIYGKVIDTKDVRIRLDVTDETMCPKFHVDNVAARLLCTYKGPGREYVIERHQTDKNRIRAMRAGAAGLFRGAKWASEERTSLLHRSPSVRPDTGPRLLLVIDPPELGAGECSA